MVVALVAGGLLLRAELIVHVRASGAGVPEVQVRNGGSVAVVAFAVATNSTREAEDQDPFVVFFDSLVDGSPAMDAGGERVVPVLKLLHSGKRMEDVLELPVLAAAIHADGTTTGDAVLLTRMVAGEATCCSRCRRQWRSYPTRDGGTCLAINWSPSSERCPTRCGAGMFQ
ncbi:MAG TPA: hypothetical protein VER03_10945 [Bryobacteraceae bacterium]|nr:hypothetical protein [Bryobacteraceae bacterium]